MDEKACWIPLPEDVEPTDDLFAVFKITDNMILLKRAFWKGKNFRSLKPYGTARILKSRKHMLKLDKKARDSVSWEDEWEIFIYSSFDDFILLGLMSLDEMEYLELRGVPAEISLPLDAPED